MRRGRGGTDPAWRQYGRHAKPRLHGQGGGHRDDMRVSTLAEGRGRLLIGAWKASETLCGARSQAMARLQYWAESGVMISSPKPARYFISARQTSPPLCAQARDR